jgi:ADP-ribose pyrophosphatase YjhB (NUDIX family)
MRNDFSVGGVVTDSSGRVALIRTTNLKGARVWGLPKGHPKAGELPVGAALREVSEETGLEVTAASDKPAAGIDYWFVAKDGERVHKRVDFYRMEAVGGDPRDHDDEVEEVALLDPTEARTRLTYGNERTVLDTALS